MFYIKVFMSSFLCEWIMALTFHGFCHVDLRFSRLSFVGLTI